jgi:hypothetical protein
MPPVKCIRYLLVFIDTLMGWNKAFPTTNRSASTVATILFREVIPHFGLPTLLLIIRQLARIYFYFHSTIDLLYWIKVALPYPIPSTILWKSSKGQAHPKKHTYQTCSGTSTRMD